MNRNTQKNVQLLDKIHTVFTAALSTRQSQTSFHRGEQFKWSSASNRVSHNKVANDWSTFEDHDWSQ